MLLLIWGPAPLLNAKLKVSEVFLDGAMKSSYVDYFGIVVTFLLLWIVVEVGAPTLDFVRLLLLFAVYASNLILYDTDATMSPIILSKLQLTWGSPCLSMSSKVFKVTSPITELSSRRTLLIVIVVVEVWRGICTK